MKFMSTRKRVLSFVALPALRAGRAAQPTLLAWSTGFTDCKLRSYFPWTKYECVKYIVVKLVEKIRQVRHL